VSYVVAHVSPSQITTWLGCRRQWYWEYPMGFKSPPKPSALIGTACHSVAEDVINSVTLADGAVEDLSVKRDGKDQYRAIVRPSLPLLLELRQLKNAGIGHVEREMKRGLRNGPVLKGRIDFIAISPYNTPDPWIVDHKTTSDLRYAKTAEELRTDIQMLAYAYEAVILSPFAKGVRVAHNVMLTRGAPQSRYTETVIPMKEIVDGWTRIQDLSDAIRETATLASPADVPENRSSCEKYGGCFHLDRCRALWAAKSGTPTTNQLETPMSTASTLPEHLRAKLLGTAGKPAPTAAAGPNRAIPAPSAPVVNPPAKPALPAALAGKLAGASGAVQVVKNQQPGSSVTVAASLLPPEAPTSPRVQKQEAEALAAAAQQPTTETTAVVDVADGAALLLSLGWAGEEVDAMDDRVFEETVAQKAKRDAVDLILDEPEADGFRQIIGFTFKVVEPPVAPARTSRVSRVAPAAPVVEQPAAPAARDSEDSGEMTVGFGPGIRSEPAAQAEPPKRRGRPPGSKNKIAGEPVTPPAAPAEVQPDPVASHYIGGESTLIAEGGEAAAEEEIAAVVAGEQEAEPLVPQVDRRTFAFAKSPANYEEELFLKDACIAELERIVRDQRDAEETRSVVTPAPVGFTLYIDCLPETPNVPYRSLDAVLAPFMEMAAKGYKNEKTGAAEPLSHYALIPFGKGPGVVAAYVLTNLAAVTTPGILYVDTRSPCAAAVLEVLRPKADAIVRRTGG
jgi:hypothetical protein